ncbi:MAG: hypothetical protein U1E94_06650 [Agitococcus sp.]
MQELILKVIALCLALAGRETLHGIFRAAVLVPKVGKRQALKISIVTGSVLAFMVCFWLVPEMGLHQSWQLLALGLLLAGFMASFDIALAKLLLKLSWKKSLKTLIHEQVIICCLV